MKTIAYVFLAHCHAGLALSGCDEFKEPIWVGTPEQWSAYDKLIEQYV